ncbi:MAG: nucleotidyltransferase family protein [Hyphomicrobiaceae bacterium]
MHPLIEQNREAIAELCRRHHVKRLDVFGSAATGAFDPATSDVDFLVEFEAGAEARAFDLYFGLKEALEVLLQRAVDLVTVPSIRNPIFRGNVYATREVIYG